MTKRKRRGLLLMSPVLALIATWLVIFAIHEPEVSAMVVIGGALFYAFVCGFQEWEEK